MLTMMAVVMLVMNDGKINRCDRKVDLIQGQSIVRRSMRIGDGRRWKTMVKVVVKEDGEDEGC